MTPKDIAERLDGIEYDGRYFYSEVDAVAKDAKKNSIVIVYGASDDLMEFEGAFRDELGAPCKVAVGRKGFFRRGMILTTTTFKRRANTLSVSAKRSGLSNLCGVKSRALAGRLKRTYPTKHSTSWKTAKCFVVGSSSVSTICNNQKESRWPQLIA